MPLEVTFYAPPDTDANDSEGEQTGADRGVDRGALTTHVMLVEEILGTEQVVWKLADVKANAPGVLCAQDGAFSDGQYVPRWLIL